MAGDLAEARRLARAATAVPQGRIALARAQLALGRDAEGSAALQRLDGVDLGVRDQVEADLLRAILALRAGSRRDAGLVLGRAAAEVDRCGLLVPLVALSDADRAELGALASAGGLAGLADALERARPGRPVDDLRMPALSKRELLVLDRLADAESTAELAELLYVSVNTVKSQLRSIYRKLGVTTREQAIARYLSLGLGREDR